MSNLLRLRRLYVFRFTVLLSSIEANQWREEGCVSRVNAICAHH